MQLSKACGGFASAIISVLQKLVKADLQVQLASQKVCEG